VRSEGKKLAQAAQLMARGQLRIDQAEQTDDSPEDEVTAALAAFGLEATEPLELDETFALWPECLRVFNLWISVQTQWRISGMGGATGLDYAGVEACMRMRGVHKTEWVSVFADLQVMERAALREWASQK
jgi:hypothetical protein